MALSFGISFAPNHPREVSEWCRASEEAGFERIGMVDSQAIYRELCISCVAGMQATKSIQLGPRVTNALTRHPTVTASALLTLNELAPGRVFAGLGNGEVWESGDHGDTWSAARLTGDSLTELHALVHA